MLFHDGIHSDGHRHTLPEFAIVAQDPDYVQRNSMAFAFGSQAFSLVGLPDTQNY